MKDCIFCRIVNKELPTEIVYEDDEILAFVDINGLAPVHILIVPKEHIESINDLDDKIGGKDLAGKLIMIAQKIARDKKIASDGYKLLFRVSKHGQQEVPHIHLHLIGGAQLEENIGVA
ncbi:MAG TPA: histidine triad nucleotide-binding protein [Lutibacter sp.]|nr:histidine triad nucleotide-binding protein [Lutibacter sp.]